MKRIILFLSLVLCSWSFESKNVVLFNGKDLSGWDTYLPATGVNNDPSKVFSVTNVEGMPALKISGEHFGGISTINEYSNYHLIVEFKWGSSRYPPKLNDKRDSGLLYHGVGEHGAGDGFWLRSQEFQIQETDCGDYWGVAGAGFDVTVKKAGAEYVYDPQGALTNFSEKSKAGRHVNANPDPEKPSGEWNTLDLYCFGDSAVHVVNGKVVMKLYHSSLPDGSPLKRGKIQFQSEGAEVFYRKIVLEAISEMPELGQ